MSIPLDNLYHYVENLCSEDIIIYRWHPHGSKKLSDLKELEIKEENINWLKKMSIPRMICHDQEPLNYNFYSKQDCLTQLNNYLDSINRPFPWMRSNEFLERLAESHLRSATFMPINFMDYTLLCHSERNSKELELYEQNNFIGVYYWSHALIARDWFRYAEHDPSLLPNFKNIKTDFLIYNRAWSGTREYRLKFVELVVDNQLLPNANIKFSPVDSDCHYTEHVFSNPAFQIEHNNFEHLLPLNTADSNSSGSYDSKDYQTSAIEVVLETLFDDQRQHLTEKILRPIACGRPFILVAPPGCLEYLRSYGFKTFDGSIDESYDKILDPLDRLNAIVLELKRIASLDHVSKHKLWNQLYKISYFNHKHFFSQQFHDIVVSEFIKNFNDAFLKCKKGPLGTWWNRCVDPAVVQCSPDDHVGFYYAKAEEWLNQHKKT